MKKADYLESTNRDMRLNMLKLTHALGRKGAHIAPSLSMTEIISTLFFEVMDWSKDLFILSKGHGGLAYYCGLKEAGFINQEQLETFDSDGGEFPGQPSKNHKYGIVFSSGSLGMGLSYGVGRALAISARNEKGKVFVVVGDGELNEGSIWESVMLANQLKLSNLAVIVDWNKLQSDGDTSEIVSLDLEAVWKAYGWNVVICDGHDTKQLSQSLKNKNHKGPLVVLARTVKGKGVSFMENNRAWHHGTLDDNQYEMAQKEICDGI